MTESILESKNAKQLMLIINPVAGRKLARKSLPEIIAAFGRNGWLVTTFITEKRGDATRFAAEFGARFELIVCSGGDGTLNETITGIKNTGLDIPVGYIPAGSTNVFADCHGLSTDVVQAALDICQKSERALDAGKFNEAWFSYIAAFGAFSWLSYSTPQNLKNKLGHTAYILDGIRELPLIKEEHISLRHDGQHLEGDYIFGSVSNCNSIACTFTFPDTAVTYDDGLFEVLLIKAPRSAAELQAIVLAMRNQDYSCKSIDFFRTGRMYFENCAETAWTIDGELAPLAPDIVIENVPRALRIIC